MKKMQPHDWEELAICCACLLGGGAIIVGATFAAGELLIRCKPAYEKLYRDKNAEAKGK